VPARQKHTLHKPAGAPAPADQGGANSFTHPHCVDHGTAAHLPQNPSLIPVLTASQNGRQRLTLLGWPNLSFWWRGLQGITRFETGRDSLGVGLSLLLGRRRRHPGPQSSSSYGGEKQSAGMQMGGHFCGALIISFSSLAGMVACAVEAGVCGSALSRLGAQRSYSGAGFTLGGANS